MKTVVHKKEDGTDVVTIDLRELTLNEARHIYNGLQVYAAQTRNANIKALAATLFASALKDYPDTFDEVVSVDAVKKQNAAMLKALSQLTPYAQDKNPVPQNLKGYIYK